MHLHDFLVFSIASKVASVRLYTHHDDKFSLQNIGVSHLQFTYVASGLEVLTKLRSSYHCKH